MIISEKVTVKNSNYYKSLGYISDLKYIEISISDLPIGSHVKILAKCDYCELTKEIEYKSYNKNISINGKFSCCIKCGCLKSKETNLVKYGTEFITQSNHFKDKSRNTVKKKWGVEHISQVDSIRESKRNKLLTKSSQISERLKDYWNGLNESELKNINEKRKSTNFERWGVEYISQLSEIKDKVRETNLEKYGGYTYQSEYLMKKVVNTNLERYGSTSSSNSESVKSKVRETNLKRYGVESASKLDKFKQRQKEKNLENWGVENIMFSEEFRGKFNISQETNYIRYTGDRNYEFHCDVCNDKYVIDYDNHYKRKLRKVNCCTNCFPISQNSSIKEIELRNFISSLYEKEIIFNYRDGLEIDIYLPDIKLGFEFNGLYWHSQLDKSYHIDKTNYFKELGIKIIHIWEDDWDNRTEIIKSQIRNWLSFNKNKIYARKCEILELKDVSLSKKFIENNHIQGFIRSKVKIGLFYNNELVSMMTFDQLEGRKKMEKDGWNLSRFCSILNTNIVGSFSKLLQYFIKKYKPSRIISFADMDWSDGNIYQNNGFSLVNVLKPDYKYIINGVRVNKQKFTKKKLTLKGFNSDKTESEIMKEMGIPKIWSCGQLKFEIKINKS